MKALFFAAALVTAGTAMAQEAPPPAPETPPAAEAPPPPAPETPPPAPDASAQPVAPGNGAPERDSRGVAVVSDPATAPAGTNAPVAQGPATINPNQAAAFATQPSSGEKPACSRTVTDNCTQTYERTRRARR
jgi:hypothetical protein